MNNLGTTKVDQTHWHLETWNRQWVSEMLWSHWCQPMSVAGEDDTTIHYAFLDYLVSYLNAKFLLNYGPSDVWKLEELKVLSPALVKKPRLTIFTSHWSSFQLNVKVSAAKRCSLFRYWHPNSKQPRECIYKHMKWKTMQMIDWRLQQLEKIYEGYTTLWQTNKLLER